MSFEYFSKNGEILPTKDAVVSLSNIEYQYGFGVYETIRVAGGIPYFIADHIERLQGSARIIGLEHTFDAVSIEKYVRELMTKNAVESCNIKILLLGGRTKEDASLYVLSLNPLYPDKKLYREGVKLVSYEYERAFPHAKTLNMLQSYLAYRKAKEQGCYDALLIDADLCAIEGTRTNFFTMKGTTVFSAPEAEILLGVTRKAVLHVARKVGLRIEERNILLSDIGSYDGAFITSTSSKIIPVSAIDSHIYGEQPKALRDLMTAFDAFLENSHGRL